MYAAIGIVILIVMVFGGFALTGGALGPVLHALPHEMLIIGGAAVGSLIIGNSGADLKALAGGLGKVFKGPAYKKQDYDTAVTALTAAYQYDNTNGDALFYLANCYYEMGDTDQAKKIYDQVINDFPGTRKASNSEAKIAEINNATN